MPGENSVISVRVDSDVKRQSEEIMEQFGLNMSTTINILLRQIIRENCIPLSLSFNSSSILREDLHFSKEDRDAGYNGKSASEVVAEMQRVVLDVCDGKR